MNTQVSDQLDAPAALPSGKESLPILHPLDRRLGDPKNQSGCCAEVKNPCPWLVGSSICPVV